MRITDLTSEAHRGIQLISNRIATQALRVKSHPSFPTPEERDDLTRRLDASEQIDANAQR
jgi:hypothetical protein